MKRVEFIKIFLLFLFCGISLFSASAEEDIKATSVTNLGYYTTTNNPTSRALLTENFVQKNQDVYVDLNANGLVSCKWTLETPNTAGCTPLSGTTPGFSFCVGDEAPVAVTFKLILDYGNGPEVITINFRVRKVVE